ncbi:hypothetical protein CFP56_021133 [Quercus suber]|uniref:Uncharacterized protein n=1 Tax=Quercus suber TaxID=58331 RepID=A0AAW0KFQ3_QUESU
MGSDGEVGSDGDRHGLLMVWVSIVVLLLLDEVIYNGTGHQVVGVPHHNSELIKAQDTVSIEIKHSNHGFAILSRLGLAESTQHPLQACGAPHSCLPLPLRPLASGIPQNRAAHLHSNHMFSRLLLPHPLTARPQQFSHSFVIQEEIFYHLHPRQSNQTHFEARCSGFCLHWKQSVKENVYPPFSLETIYYVIFPK